MTERFPRKVLGVTGPNGERVVLASEQVLDRDVHECGNDEYGIYDYCDHGVYGFKVKLCFVKLPIP